MNFERSKTADQFRMKLLKARQDFEQEYTRRVSDVRTKYAATLSPIPFEPKKSPEVALLEAHLRIYLINDLLSALNWQILGRNSEAGLLIPEAPIKSSEKSTIRFLDYYGQENGVDSNPLLIIETKHPASFLPTLAPDKKTKNNLSPSDVSVVVDGLKGEKLTGKWNEWLKTLTDYVLSIRAKSGNFPRRAVMTNGDWWIIFLDPENAFSKNRQIDSEKIIVFTNWPEAESAYLSLFEWLDYFSVCDRLPPLVAVGLNSYVDSSEIKMVMHGLRLSHTTKSVMYNINEPEIHVTPILFLCLFNESWVTVENRNSKQIYKIPSSVQKRELQKHLEIVKSTATELLEEVNKTLGTQFNPTSLIDYYENEKNTFLTLGGVKADKTHSSGQEFLVVTGSITHYLLPNPSVTGCPYHEWSKSQKDSVAAELQALSDPKVSSPISYFVSGSNHYCSHRNVDIIKLSPITHNNTEKCGPRSGKKGQAFCEIALF